MREVFLQGGGVNLRIYLLIYPKNWGLQGLEALFTNPPTPAHLWSTNIILVIPHVSIVSEVPFTVNQDWARWVFIKVKETQLKNSLIRCRVFLQSSLSTFSWECQNFAAWHLSLIGEFWPYNHWNKLFA